MSENFKNELFEVVISLNTKEECESFFRDLCTEREITDLSARLRVAKLLDLGVNYNDIATMTGASTATISRVSKCLSGAVGGYRSVLSKSDKPVGSLAKLAPYLTAGEEKALSLRELFLSCGYEPHELPSALEYEFLREFSEWSDTRRLVLLQGADGMLYSLTPDPAPASFKVQKDGERISYSAKLTKRGNGAPVAEYTAGVMYKGDLTLSLRAEMLSSAAEAARLQHRGAVLSVFNTDILKSLTSKYGISGDDEAELFTVLDSGSEKKLSELLAEKEIPEDARKIFTSLLKLPQSADAAIKYLRELLPSLEFSESIDTLSGAVSALESKRVRVEVNQSSIGEGLVFSSRKAGLFGREYKKPYTGMGFKLIIS